MEAASAVDGFGAGRLSSLLTELLTTQSAAEPRVRRLVLLIERSCREGARVKDYYRLLLSLFLSLRTLFLPVVLCHLCQSHSVCLRQRSH